MRARRAALPTLVLVALLGSPVTASHRDVHDANEVRGRLDLRKISVYGRPRVWHLETYNSWTSRSMWDQGYLIAHLDTISGQRFDYYALLSSDGHSMDAFLFRDRAVKADYRVAKLRTWRSSRRGVKVRIPLTKATISKGRDFFRWQIRTLFTGRGCRRSCIDFAPLGPVEEPLGPPASRAPGPSSSG